MKKSIVLLLIIILTGNLWSNDDVMDKVWKLYDEKKYDKGLKLIDKEIKLQGESSRLLQAKFYFLDALEKYDEALKVALHREEIAERKSPWLCMDIVSMYLKKEDVNNSLKWLDEAVNRGFISYNFLTEEDYEIIQDHEKFQSLIKTIKAKVGIDQPAKDFTVELLDGKSFKLGKQKGKVVLLDFWATWCSPCREEIPNLKRLYAEFKDKNFEIIGISLDKNQDKLKDYLEKEGITWKISSSGESWNDEHVQLYGVNSIPSMWLVDKNGILRHFGLRGEKLEAAVKELVKE